MSDRPTISPVFKIVDDSLFTISGFRRAWHEHGCGALGKLDWLLNTLSEDLEKAFDILQDEFNETPPSS